ncbi:MAG: hypothetical protein CMK59_06535 [Proteobacteria bacterium]|nr:hypothetical protein [Pseudomonadota bacterium]
MILFITNIAFAQECPKTTIERAVIINSTDLDEVSGLSLGSNNTAWVHNDSGDGPYLYGINTEDQSIQKVTVQNAFAQDWEDIAIERSELGVFLFIADLGDNKEKRQQRSIYVIQEPTQNTVEIVSRLDLDYGTLGPKDIESIAIDPNDHSLYLTTKGRGGTVFVLNLPLKQHKPSGPIQQIHSYAIAQPKSKYNPKYVTAMDISPDGTMMVIRDYTKVKLWTKTKEQNWKDVLPLKPCVLHLPLQPQGESISFSEDSSAIWTLSEKEKQPLYELKLHFPHE